ncbi:glutamine amidotransferase [Caballeronia insecticola]|uniref:Putative glutamine amidotransferase protein n=1 Tax=Caballeronia insecticola TaxID=758793 RepID=A0A060PGY3_9BURK|nr:glutamine amidotransferase [Caballeronia insecticola]BAO94042.1 putative glutamine amidotransferase protein [Caballeronia insecticola]
MTNKPIVLIQAGTAPDKIRKEVGDYPSWFCSALDLDLENLEIVRVFEGEVLPSPDPARAAIITGSFAMVTDRLLWSETTAQWIRDAMTVEMPLFGVCYGHQLMAHALGGRVGYHPAGQEIGCQEIRLLDSAAADPLLTGMPARFAAHLTHLQSVIDVPPGARVLAASDHDPHQIIRYGRQAISAQFHPEFDREICAAIVRLHADSVREEGGDPDALLAQITSTAEAKALLTRFVEQALGRPATRAGDTLTLP